MTHAFAYSIDQLLPYINWIYFFHAWGFEPRYARLAHEYANESATTTDDKKAAAARLLSDARSMLISWRGKARGRALVGLYAAHSEGDDVVIQTPQGLVRLPFLRQQTVAPGHHYLCLSDFIKPAPGFDDKLGLFATTFEQGSLPTPTDNYEAMLQQTLSDRLAEAASEILHLEVRRRLWGYAPNEHLSIDQLLAGRFVGIRPAVGYPSLPDQSFAFLIDHVLHLHEIGISLTESGAMRPHASECGLMFAHPASRYFSIGTIGEDSLYDYARRRKLPVERMRRFLASVLLHTEQKAEATDSTNIPLRQS